MHRFPTRIIRESDLLRFRCFDLKTPECMNVFKLSADRCNFQILDVTK